VVGPGVVVLIIDPTLVDQHRELANLQIPDELFDLWAQSVLKLDALLSFKSYIIVVGTKFGQLLELGSIVNHGHVSLH
jgi:hypothetical protein